MSLPLYNMLPVSVKQSLQSFDISLLVADNKNVKVLGVTKVKGQTPHGTHWFTVYIFNYILLYFTSIYHWNSVSLSPE